MGIPRCLMRPGAPEVTAIYFTRSAEPIPRGPARWTPSRWKLRIAWGKRGFHRISMVEVPDSGNKFRKSWEISIWNIWNLYEIYIWTSGECLELWIPWPGWCCGMGCMGCRWDSWSTCTLTSSIAHLQVPPRTSSVGTYIVPRWGRQNLVVAGKKRFQWQRMYAWGSEFVGTLNHQHPLSALSRFVSF